MFNKTAKSWDSDDKMVYIANPRCKLYSTNLKNTAYKRFLKYVLPLRNYCLTSVLKINK